MNLLPRPREWPIGHMVTYHHIANPDAIRGPVLVLSLEQSADNYIVSNDPFAGLCYSLPRLTTRFKAVTTTTPETP